MLSTRLDVVGVVTAVMALVAAFFFDFRTACLGVAVCLGSGF